VGGEAYQEKLPKSSEMLASCSNVGRLQATGGSLEFNMQPFHNLGGLSC
jgi:hypothetical protein